MIYYSLFLFLNRRRRRNCKRWKNTTDNNNNRIRSCDYLLLSDLFPFQFSSLIFVTSSVWFIWWIFNQGSRIHSLNVFNSCQFQIILKEKQNKLMRNCAWMYWLHMHTISFNVISWKLHLTGIFQCVFQEKWYNWCQIFLLYTWKSPIPYI